MASAGIHNGVGWRVLQRDRATFGTDEPVPRIGRRYRVRLGAWAGSRATRFGSRAPADSETVWLGCDFSTRSAAVPTFVGELAMRQRLWLVKPLSSRRNIVSASGISKLRVQRIEVDCHLLVCRNECVYVVAALMIAPLVALAACASPGHPRMLHVT